MKDDNGRAFYLDENGNKVFVDGISPSVIFK